MIKDTFYNRSRIGQKGEMEFKNWLVNERKIPTGNIKDVRKDPFWQSLDIDFLVKSLTGDLLKVEVKTSNTAHLTGYLVWDFTKNSGAVGKLERSQADVVFWYFPVTGEKYIMKLPLTREYIHNANHLELKQMYDSQVYLLDIDKLIEEKLLTKI